MDKNKNFGALQQIIDGLHIHNVLIMKKDRMSERVRERFLTTFENCKLYDLLYCEGNNDKTPSMVVMKLGTMSYLPLWYNRILREVDEGYRWDNFDYSVVHGEWNFPNHKVYSFTRLHNEFERRMRRAYSDEIEG